MVKGSHTVRSAGDTETNPDGGVLLCFCPSQVGEVWSWTMRDNFVLRYECVGQEYSLTIDDNGRVCYAYMLFKEEIVADVWLYNRCPAPAKPEWVSGGAMPFANSRGYVVDDEFVPPSSKDEIVVEWREVTGRKGPVAAVVIRGLLHATLSIGEKPGRCRLALRSGPLAQRLL